MNDRQRPVERMLRIRNIRTANTSTSTSMRTVLPRVALTLLLAAGIGLVAYVLATLIFQIPGTLAYAYLGYAGSELAAGERHAIDMILYGISALLIQLVLPRLVYRWQQARR